MSNTPHHSCFVSTSSELPATTKVQAIAILNSTLATAVDLKTQIKQAQWNVVTGNNCKPLQELFAEIATQLEEYTDIFAERLKALGGLAIATARVVAELSILPEYPYHTLDGIEHVEALVERLTLWARSLLQESLQIADWGDRETSELYLEVFEMIEQRLWLLQAYLQVALIPRCDRAVV